MKPRIDLDFPGDLYKLESAFLLKEDEVMATTFYCLKHGVFSKVTAKSPEGADGSARVKRQAELIIQGKPRDIGVRPTVGVPLTAHDDNDIRLLEKGQVYLVIVHNSFAIDDAIFAGKGEGKLFLFLVFTKNNIRFWVYRHSLCFIESGGS